MLFVNVALFLFLDAITYSISIGNLELVKNEMLKKASDLGYKLDISKQQDILKMWYGDKSKLYTLLTYIPGVNILVHLKNSSDNKIDKVISNLIENKTLIPNKDNNDNIANKVDKQVVNLGNDKPELLINNKRTSLGLALELKSKISEILMLDIDDNEKNNMIIELLESYEIIPHEEKIKVKKLEK